jgi:hypothetical protein
MTATAPAIPAGGVEYAESEEQIVTGKRQRKRRKKKLPTHELLLLLQDYFSEAQEARQSGTESRENNWLANWDAYWGRSDGGDKAEWQANEHMPEVANFVDRHTASMRLALLSQPEWFDIHDPTDPSRERDRMMREFTKLHLDHCTTNASGQRIGFDTTFSSAVKSGAMTVIAASVTYDPISKFVNIDPVNAFELYYDPTGRGLYRIRRKEVDYHQLELMKRQTDSKGKPLYDNKAIDRLQAHCDSEAKADRERISGGSEAGEGSSRRKPVMIDEYLCTIIDREGKLIAQNQLVVVGNQREILRGAEDNPNWHGKDWIVMTPTIDVPFAIWGRSWVEVFRALAATFTEVTNLILDGVFASNIGAHMIWTEALADPSEVTEGIYPGLAVQAEADWPAGKPFIEKIDMGGVDAQGIQVWQALKAELREGASTNELSLGQVPPKGDITAREIEGSERGSSVLTMGMAKDIETKFLAPILELTLMTGLQHFDAESNPTLTDALGPAMTAMLAENKRNFADKRYSFVATGISSAMDRGKRLQGLTNFLQILGQSEILAAKFTEEFSINALVKQLLIHFDIDERSLSKTDKEKLKDSQQEALNAAKARLEGGGGGRPSEGPTGAGSRGGSPQQRIPA